MKSSLLTVCAALCLCTSSFSQAFNGKLGYSISPVGHPDDFSQFGSFLQEVASTCNGGVVMANGNWTDSVSVSGNIPTLHKTISLLQPTPYAYTDLLVFAWATYPVVHLTSPTDTTNN